MSKTIILSFYSIESHFTPAIVNGTIAYHDDYKITATGTCMEILSIVLVVTYCLGIGMPLVMTNEQDKLNAG